jgi:hypothetical protein
MAACADAVWTSAEKQETTSSPIVRQPAPPLSTIRIREGIQRLIMLETAEHPTLSLR